MHKVFKVNDKETVLITGGAGFIGSNIAKYFITQNDYNIIIADNLSTGNLNNISNLAIKFIECDILNKIKLEEIFLLNNIDYVIHQAAQSSVDKSLENPAFNGEENIIGTINLLKLSVKYKIKKFIFASSASVYGIPQYLPIDEEHPLNPVSFYGISKQSAENYIKLFNKLFSLNFIILRYSNVYGNKDFAGENETNVISIFYKNILNNKEIIIYGDGLQTRDFVFVKDIAIANYLSLKNNIKNEIFNVGSGEKTSVIEIYKILSNLLNKNISINYKNNKIGDINHSYFNINKIKRLLNWEPFIKKITYFTSTYDN